MSLDIKWFKQEGDSKRLGGGYITSGGLKTAFSVFKSEKSKYGFNISLPYRKNTDGTIVNEVQFVTKEINEQASEIVYNLLNGKSMDGEPTPRIVKESEGLKTSSGPATAVDVKASIKRHGAKPPF